jgi:phage tail-like protein
MRAALLRGDSFAIELAGVAAAGFVRCTGLESRRRVVAYREGGSDTARLFDDGSAPGRLVLERGVARDRSLWEWYESGDARDGAVVLLDAAGSERMRWELRGAFPAAWGGPHLDAESTQVALERLEIVYESLRWNDSRANGAAAAT